MSFPKKQTVGDLMNFLQKQLDEGIITRGSSVFIEMYAMTEEDSALKERQEELEYHIPDDINDETFSFTTGVWSGPACPRKDGAAYVALSCYLTNRRLREIADDKLE